MNTMNSKKTSRNMISMGFKHISWEPNTLNFDIGGGKFEKNTEYLITKGVTNLVYDPYNRTRCHNSTVLYLANISSTSTIFNVLNVIPNINDRIELLYLAKRPATKFIYISVYEKNGSGIGEKTRDGWQNNMKLAEYIPEISSIYPQYEIKNKLITITI